METMIVRLNGFLRAGGLVLAAGMLSVLSSQHLQAEPLPLRAYLSMQVPASGYDATRQAYTGFEVDLINALLDGAPVDLAVSFADAPVWKRSLENIRTGEANFLPLVSYRPERLTFMDYIGVFNTEAAYLVTRAEESIGDLDDIDDLVLGPNFIEIDEAIAWNPEFEKRLQEDPEYRSNFFVKAASDFDRVLDIERLKTDVDYRKKMESEHDLVFVDGRPALMSDAQRISMGRLGGTIVIKEEALVSVKETEAWLAAGGHGKPLKATPIRAFGIPVTYLAASLQTPVEIRQHMKKRYAELRQSGEFDALWAKWYGELDVPGYIPPGEETVRN